MDLQPFLNQYYEKIISFFISLGLCVASVAQVARDAASILPKGFDPWNIQRQYDAAKLKDFVPDGARAGGTAAGKAKKALKRADADKIEAQDYFTVAQTFYDGPNFVYDGGQVNTYSVGVTVDGTKVTFSNMFNFADYVCSDPKPVEGTYDPVAKTVTIPTPASFDKGTQVGLIYNYYVGVLASGEVDKDGNMTPSEELVFNVEGDFDRIYTTQHFGVSQYMPDGSKSMGYFGVYRYWSMTLPKPGAKLLQLNDNIDFGEVFPDTPMPKYFKVINTGLDAADYVVTVDSDGDSFSASSVSGTVQGQSAAVLTFNFEAGAVGDYEGIATIEYEGGEPLLLLMNGKVKPVPDYSAIVKNGEFRFTTSLDFPFEIKDVNGMSVAHSTQGGKAGQAFIAVKTVVPEGQLGKLSWKGMFNNSGEWYKVQGGIFIDDMTTARYTYTGQNEDAFKDCGAGFRRA